MNFSNKFSYSMNSDFDVADTLRRLEALFVHESIGYILNQTSITSHKVPFSIICRGRRNRSKLNWVGIHPFLYVSNISIDVEALDDGTALMEIEIDQKRAIMIYLFWVTVLMAVSSRLPGPILSLSFFGVLSMLSGYLIFGLCLRQLLRDQIKNVVKA